tara:strand:+ start:1481 stop:1966 length:486 start_codon:yes stop_codon:yes gene_type:complete
MRSKNVDFSPEIRESRILLAPEPQPASERLHDALAFLCEKHNSKHAIAISVDQLLAVYTRGYFNNEEGAQGERPHRALARTLLFLKMEEGKIVPYLYKKLDQDLSATTPLIFDDGERPALRFTKEQLIEACLLGRRFGIEHYEEELSLYLTTCEAKTASDA